MTNLEWGPTKENVTWDEAREWIDSLGDGWRMPTVQELVSAFDYDAGRPAVDGFGSLCCWSASTCAIDPFSAWVVYFHDGNVDVDDKPLSTMSVRAVRGGSDTEATSREEDANSAEIIATALKAGRATGKAGAELAEIDREKWKKALDEAHESAMKDLIAEYEAELTRLKDAIRFYGRSPASYDESGNCITPADVHVEINRRFNEALHPEERARIEESK